MSITKCLAPHKLVPTINLHGNQSHRFHANLPFNPIPRFPTTKHALTSLTTGQRWQSFIVCSDVQPGGAPPPPPSNPQQSSWKNWVIGAFMTVILPFFTTKGGPVKVLIQKVDRMVETAEEIAETVENVADKVDKVVEQLSDDLPENSKIKKTLDFIEDVAEKLEKDAHEAGDFIDKVQEMQDKIEDLMEPVYDEAKKVSKEVDSKEKHHSHK